MTRTWQITPPDPALIEQLTRETGVSPLVATLLVARGVTETAAASRFLAPRLRELPDPLLLAGMEAAVERTLRAMRDDEPITVWGDYDVDGVTSVSQLTLFLRQLGVPVRFFIPDRLRDGYGLNAGRLAELAADGTRLVITVDCGISAVAEVAGAKELGVDVIVIDHHQLPEELPDAVAVINPLQEDCAFPFSGMAACGLTFYFLIALRAALRKRGVFDHLREPVLESYLDLVSLGTIADVVPLVRENRTLVHRGLQELGRSTRPGIRALRDVAGLAGQPIDATAVGFGLAPRLNAAGRVGDACRAVELLTCSDDGRARALAAELERDNRDRRALQQKTMNEAIERVEADDGARERSAIVLADEGWHSGVVGIVASKVAQRYERPAVLIALNAEGIGRGSARSVEGLDLYAALGDCQDLLDAWGGHGAAGGVTLRAENVAPFRERLERAVRDRLGADPEPPPLALDAELPLASVDRALIAELDHLAPFGSANPAPRFASFGVEVVSQRIVGEHHLQLKLRQGKAERDAIAFQMAHLRPKTGARIDVAYRPEIDRWRGRERLRLRVVDLRPAEGLDS